MRTEYPWRETPGPAGTQRRGIGTRRALRLVLGVAALGAALLLPEPRARAAEGAEGTTAVSSEVFKGYARAKLPDGSYQPEDYAFGNGGFLGGPFPDPTIDRLSFMDVARVIAVPLAEQKYFPAKNPDKTKLLIMVYWGTTVAPERPRGEEDSLYRDQLDYQNSELLGYDTEGLIGTLYGANLDLTALRLHRRDLITDIEYNRYVVVMMAYDFQSLRSQKVLKPLWETRFSLNQRSNEFDKALPAMAKIASRYFGVDSKGLVRSPMPEGKVEIGEPTLIELLPPDRR